MRTAVIFFFFIFRFVVLVIATFYFLILFLLSICFLRDIKARDKQMEGKPTNVSLVFVFFLLPDLLLLLDHVEPSCFQSLSLLTF